ncbi:MAG: cation:proton antiporter [Candidatus Thorarchaeota archaeon]
MLETIISGNFLVYAFALVILFGILAGKFAETYNFPKMIPLILTGVLMAVLANITNITIDLVNIREYVLVIAELALIVVLFREGMHLDLDSLKKYFLSIITLAVIGTIITIILVGLTISISTVIFPSVFISFSIIGALLVGAIIVPTDPAATFSILRGSGIRVKKRVEIILGGESAFNDAIAILFVVVLTVPMLKGDLAVSFDIIYLAIWEMLGGILFGVFVGYFINILSKFIHSQTEMSYVTLTGVFLIFALSPVIQVSSAIAALIAGILVRNPEYIGQKPFVKTRIFDFWDDVVFLFEIMAFVFIGILFEVAEITTYLMLGLILSVIAIFARLIGVFLSTLPLELSKETAEQLSNKERMFITFSGFKGLTTAILASYAFIELTGISNLGSLPKIILYSSLVFILVSGSIQGLLLPKIAKKFEVTEKISELDEIKLKQSILRIELQKLLSDRDLGKITPNQFLTLSIPIKEELYLTEEKISSLIAKERAQKEFLSYQIELTSSVIENLTLSYNNGELSTDLFENTLKTYEDRLLDLKVQLGKIEDKIPKPTPLPPKNENEVSAEVDLLLASESVKHLSKLPEIMKKIPELNQVQKILASSIKSLKVNIKTNKGSFFLSKNPQEKKGSFKNLSESDDQQKKENE